MTVLAPSRGGFTFLAVCLLFVGACDSPDRTGQNAADPRSAAPFVIEEETTIGGDAATGPMALGSIGTARLIGSSVFVPEVMAQEIRVFDLSGEYVETIGRRGSGPGEYEGLSAVFELPGGGVVGWEQGRRTATVHGRAGTETVPLLRGQFPNRTPRLLGVLPDTTFVLGLPREATALRAVPPGRFTDTVPFVRVDRRGLMLDTIALIEAPQRELFNVGPMWGLELAIFGDELRSTVTGGRLVVVSGREVRRQSTSGTFLVHEWEPPSPSITPDLVTAERERRISERGIPRVQVNGERSLGELYREVVQGLPVADPLPAFDHLATGKDRAVWVRALTMPGDTMSSWFRIDADGRIEGRLELPAGERIESGSAEHVIVRGRDSLGSIVLRILTLR